MEGLQYCHRGEALDECASEWERRKAGSIKKSVPGDEEYDRRKKGKELYNGEDDGEEKKKEQHDMAFQEK